MNPSQNYSLGKEAADSAEQTLRMIANLPAPEGLTERVQNRLRNAPRSSRRMAWPLAFAPVSRGNSHAWRSAAAAAIVCVVAGGGWQIYAHVQPSSSARVVVTPEPVRPARGFSIGGSVHTPDPGVGRVRMREMGPQRAGDDSGPTPNPASAPGKILKPRNVRKGAAPSPDLPR